MNIIITKDYLEQYREEVKEYAHYSKKIKWLNNQLIFASDIDSAKQQKALLRAIKEYQRLKPKILETQEIIRQQIAKIKKPRYRSVLTMRYVYHYKWGKIKEILFSDAEDFEYLKDEKYKDKTFFWHRSALECLKRTNEEEITATKKLRQIKNLCSDIDNTICSYKDFFYNVKVLLDI